jgi:hypothetical protein
MSRAWIIVALVAAPLTGRAAPGDVVLLPVEARGAVAPDVMGRVDAQIEDRAVGHRMVTPAELAGVSHDCAESVACWAEVARKLGGRRLILSTIAPGKSDDSYVFFTIIIDADNGGTVVGQGKRTVPRGALGLMPGKLIAEVMWQAPRLGAPPPPPAEPAEAPIKDRRADPVLAVDASSGASAPPGAVAEVAAIAPRVPPPRWLVGVRVGVALPEGWSRLGPGVALEVEAAYQLPIWGRRLGVFADAGYTQLSASGRYGDPRVMAQMNAINYQLGIDDVGLALGLQLRLQLGDWGVFVLGGGAALHVLMAHVDQQAGGADVGSASERSLRAGVLGRVGLGVHVWRGDLLLDVRVDYATVGDLLTGDSNIGRLGFQLGYLIRI